MEGVLLYHSWALHTQSCRFAVFICLRKVCLPLNVLCKSGAETITAPEREPFLSQLLIGWSYLPRINKPSSRPRWVESIRVLIRKYDCFILHLTAPVCHMGIRCHFMTTSSTGAKKKKTKKMEWEEKEREGDIEEKFNNIKSQPVRGFTEAGKKRKNNLLFYFFFFPPEWNIGEEEKESW